MKYMDNGFITEKVEVLEGTPLTNALNKAVYGAPKTKYQTFEDFLQEKHGEDYIGTDDDMPDRCDDWCSNLDVQEVMDYAQEWGDSLVKKSI